MERQFLPTLVYKLRMHCIFTDFLPNPPVKNLILVKVFHYLLANTTGSVKIPCLVSGKSG